MGTTPTMNVAELDARERHAREAAEEARERIVGLSGQRGRAFLDALDGDPEAEEQARALDAELSELERRVQNAELAAEEAARLREEERGAEEERARLAAREEYDQLAGERRALLEAVEDALDELDHAANTLLTHDAQQSATSARAGLPHGGDFGGLLSGRLSARLVHLMPRGFINHPVYQQPLTETDRMGLSVAELEEAQAAERRRAEEQAAKSERFRELSELSDRIATRRFLLVREYGGGRAMTPAQKHRAAVARAEEQLKKEFPILAAQASNPQGEQRGA